MAESTPNIGDLLNFLGGANPVAGIGKTIEQFRNGVGNFIKAVEAFNATMVVMQGVAVRVQSLLDDVEPPLRAAMPGVTSAVNSAQQLIDFVSEPLRAVVPQIEGAVGGAVRMVESISEPMQRVAPGLTQLADTLGAPSLTRMPEQLADFLDVLGDLGRRLGPLTQLAETAGGLFGLRGLSTLASGSRSVVQSMISEPSPSRPATTKQAPPSVTKQAAARSTTPSATATRAAAPAARVRRDTPASSAGPVKAAAKGTTKRAASSAAAKAGGARSATPAARAKPTARTVPVTKSPARKSAR